jgi:hypothetical protein
MPQASDSNYIALTRHRRPFSTAGRKEIDDIACFGVKAPTQ